VKKGNSWKRLRRKPPFRQYFSAETEESPLLEAVNKEQWVKTKQAGKDFAGGAVICEVWRFAVVL
jgi:hypothetical protein